MTSIFYDFNSIFFDGYKIYFQTESEKNINLDLFEHEVNSDLYILIDESPSFTISIFSHLATKSWIKTISLSSVIVFRIGNKLEKELSLDEKIFLGITRYSEDFQKIYIDLYSYTYQKIIDKADLYFKSNKPIFLLDLDKTLIFSSGEDFTEEQKQNFISHFSINDYTTYSTQKFFYNIMIRLGSKEFLKKLFEITDRVYIITAGDINYAKNIVKKACEFWKVPLKYIFSVRINKFLTKPKLFNQIIPLRFSNPKHEICYLAVDDNVNVWEDSDRNKVIQVKPFDPCYNDGDDLINILYKIYNFSLKL